MIIHYTREVISRVAIRFEEDEIVEIFRSGIGVRCYHAKDEIGWHHWKPSRILPHQPPLATARAKAHLESHDVFMSSLSPPHPVFIGEVSTSAIIAHSNSLLEEGGPDRVQVVGGAEAFVGVALLLETLARGPTNQAEGSTERRCRTC
jgi:hypothetical protein